MRFWGRGLRRLFWSLHWVPDELMNDHDVSAKLTYCFPLALSQPAAAFRKLLLGACCGEAVDPAKTPNSSKAHLQLQN